MATEILRCGVCSRAIEVCECCDQLDCPPPICDRDLIEAILRSVRSHYVHRGASLTEERTVEASVPG